MQASRASAASWPWREPEDRGLGARALASLHDIAALGAREASWLVVALDAAAGAPPGLSIPWASWALRLCERARVLRAAGDAAIAVTAIAAPSTEPCPDELARSAIAARVIARHAGAERAYAWALCLAEHPRMATAHNPTMTALQPAGDAVSRALSGAREVVALWTVPALLAGEDPAPWSRVGRALAAPIRVLEGLVRLWLDPASPDIASPTMTSLLALWLSAPELRPPLLRALSGDRVSPVRRFEIHSLLASRPYRAAVARGAGEMLAAARVALAAARDAGDALAAARDALAAAGEELVDRLGERYRFFDELMSVRDLLSVASADAVGMKERAGAAPFDEGAVGRDLDAAVDFLAEDAPWRGSWEVQRFGMRGSEERAVGQWFVRGTILLALAESGREIRADVKTLLDEIPPGELRYFGSCRDIPPDADDLGLMLELAAWTDADRERFESWIAVMLANVRPDGTIPTWFYRSPGGAPTTTGAAWGGDDCSTVRLNLLAGLLSFDAGRFAELIDANARQVLSLAGADAIDGSYFYDTATADLAFLRFARLYRGKGVGITRRTQVSAVEESIHRRALGGQRLDGGWGTPQSTAAYLEAVAMMDAPDDLPLWRGLRYLGEHQLVDGSWPAEPFYRITMKRGREGHHRGRALTTAVCARGFAKAAARLRERRKEGRSA